MTASFQNKHKNKTHEKVQKKAGIFYSDGSRKPIKAPAGDKITRKNWERSPLTT